MTIVKTWKFWMTFVVGAVVIPLASVALSFALDNASKSATLEEQLAIQKAEIQFSKLATQLTDLRGALTELYARLGRENLPDAYWEAVNQARAARLNLINDNLAEASEQITSAWENVYSIPVPVGPPLIHSEPINIEIDL